MNYLKASILKNNSNQTKDLFVLEGINGSGKTTLLRAILQFNSENKKINIVDTYIYKKKIKERYPWVLNNNIHNNMTQKHALELYYFTGLNKLSKSIEFYSSGQKKKLEVVSLLIGNSQLWYMDEPKNYLDTISYNVLSNRIKQHLNMSGKIIITNNTSTVVKEINKIISLSRFELLTTRLSSECSTTEL